VVLLPGNLIKIEEFRLFFFVVVIVAGEVTELLLPYSLLKRCDDNILFIGDDNPKPKVVVVIVLSENVIVLVLLPCIGDEVIIGVVNKVA